VLSSNSFWGCCGTTTTVGFNVLVLEPCNGNYGCIYMVRSAHHAVPGCRLLIQGAVRALSWRPTVKVNLHGARTAAAVRRPLVGLGDLAFIAASNGCRGLQALRRGLSQCPQNSTWGSATCP